ncbi:MAG: DUF1638 domain-containing protein [Deltaproteobacteria bacterium]|nr:DUF1638 domain-containing protein [Deltaproteobacteria bacterium]
MVRPPVMMACQVLQDMIRNEIPGDIPFHVTFFEYGLHRNPRVMKRVLQNALDEIEEPRTVVLGYGLCGNGLDGLRAGPHTLLIPRTDDCIAILLGSYEAYQREFWSTPGTYYLSKGWLECGSHPLKEYEEVGAKYGKDEAEWILDMQYKKYERLCLVAHSRADLEKYRPQAQEVARFCERWNYRYEEILGSSAYVRRLLEVAVDLSKADSDFVLVRPGGVVTQSLFIR